MGLKGRSSWGTCIMFPNLLSGSQTAKYKYLPTLTHTKNESQQNEPNK